MSSQNHLRLTKKNPTSLYWLPAPCDFEKRLSGDVTEILSKVLEAEPSGIDFPEMTYGGDWLEAYKSVCSQLGKIPREDKGHTLTRAHFSDVKKPTDQEIDDAAWDEVLSHLKLGMLCKSTHEIIAQLKLVWSHEAIRFLRSGIRR